MASTILSSLGEPILHRNSLATITSNWVVIRRGRGGYQAVVAIETIVAIRAIKTVRLYSIAWSISCLLISLATLCSKEADGATYPFAVLGLILLVAGQATRHVAISFVVGDKETIATDYGSLSEAATLIATVRGAACGRETFGFFAWARAYTRLLV